MMNNLELANKINQFRHSELIELAEQERLIKLAHLNQHGKQILGAKIIALFKSSPVNNGNKGKTSREPGISDPCCSIVK